MKSTLHNAVPNYAHHYIYTGIPVKLLPDADYKGVL